MLNEMALVLTKVNSMGTGTNNEEIGPHVTMWILSHLLWPITWLIMLLVLVWKLWKWLVTFERKIDRNDPTNGPYR